MEEGLSQKLNTGTANRNNNDHVISFDGKWLGISSHLNSMAGEVLLYIICPSPWRRTKVIAYLYGGQGTINTPGWSPESKRIAFVSNSGPVAK